MAAMSDYLEGQIIAHIFRSATWAKPSSLSFALYTTATDDASGGTEVPTSGTGYSRVSVTPSDANFSAPTAGNGQTSNSTQIAFPTATASWGTVTHFAILDQSGNRLLHGPLSASRSVGVGDGAAFNPSTLTLTLA